MPKLPKISIIIPLYNREKTIERAIRSVFKQNFSKEYEIIIIDDGSTDDSVSLVNSLRSSKIRLIQQENSGVSAARNRGIREAKSALIAFLDSDDEWKPCFLSIIWRMTKNFPEAGAYATGYYLKYPDGNTVQAQIKTSITEKNGGILEDYFACVSSGNGPIFASAVCIPKKVFKNLGGFPEQTSLNEDLQMWIKIALTYPIAFSPLPAAIYYKDTVNSSCRNIVPKRSDMIFADTINTAINDSLLRGKEATSARRYVNTWAIRNSFKDLIAGNKTQAREILSLVTPFTLKDHVQLFIMTLMSILPSSLTRIIWIAGKWVKTKLRRSIATQ